MTGSNRSRGKGNSRRSTPSNLVFCHKCACYCTHNEDACRSRQDNIKAYYNCHDCHKSSSTEIVEGTIFVPSIPCSTCNNPMSYADNTY